MDDKEKQELADKFTVICKNCRSDNVKVTFCGGFIGDCCGDTGYLEIECADCHQKIEFL